MAAGLGFKDFTTGEVLTAADVDGYLMQGVWVFASAAARDAAVTSPQEGNFAYLKDTNVTTYYTGSAWANLDTTGMTNPMTTTGDTIYSSSGSTPARLGIGTAGQVLTVNTGATAPEWATPAGGGGMTSIASGSLSGSSVVISTIVGTYKNLQLVVRDFSSATGTNFNIVLNAIADYNQMYLYSQADTAALASLYEQARTSILFFGSGQLASATDSTAIINIYDYADTTANKMVQLMAQGEATSPLGRVSFVVASVEATAAITDITIAPNTGTFSAGTYTLYGVK